ncbi:MAG: zinc-ribbon domain-containing protein [Dehalococcoidia bacterium]|nr:zinc-ribbon domain-containing protein [Dehalococcoidia bacterium]
MSFEDKTITCRDCGQTFTFTESEQQFFAEKGFTNEPKRCPTCRRAKREGSSSTAGSQRTW